MRIELKLRAEQAAEAIDWLLNIIRRDAPQLSGKAMGNAEKCASALRAALAQQPATGAPVYWEWRHLGNNQFAADFGQWSEWKRVEARSPIFTAEDELRTLRRYIADGYKYELRALYTHPAPSVPDDVVRDAERYRWLKDRNNKAQTGVGRWESDDHFTWLCDLDADVAIDAARLDAKEGGA